MRHGEDRRPRCAAAPPRDRGSMAVEVVVLVPLLVLMMFLVVAFGRFVSAEGAAQAMARDAVRAATLERSGDAALAAARAMADAAAPDSLRCEPAELTGDFVAGDLVTVEVRCRVSFSDLGLVGLPGSADVTGSSTAPLDTWRRTGG
ncbi:pilus assembly protein [Cellulomonas sp. zg-ZUI199]|uniref:Pilus assembly protein n=1 Tax=Cellulomonas wangleii TaxID=2816956 RepID=A0ABX8D3Z1_9CELL|nr:TadE/TadG family type IV pilus assembly protein [Cellulomonas wangleii]MBO0923874.1 pilus assembly protein [Cellulomonas wangleii]MBO0924156.1 pilus assembly protein [Cellulomonas wangleii]QVI62180.1 pilus assembly protein [Cellulomonas wangleii]